MHFVLNSLEILGYILLNNDSVEVGVQGGMPFVVDYELYIFFYIVGNVVY